MWGSNLGESQLPFPTAFFIAVNLIIIYIIILSKKCLYKKKMLYFTLCHKI